MVTTRNARLAAIHSLFRYAALQAPDHAALIQRVLAFPSKRTSRTIICYLTRDEMHALLAIQLQAISYQAQRHHRGITRASGQYERLPAHYESYIYWSMIRHDPPPSRNAEHLSTSSGRCRLSFQAG